MKTLPCRCRRPDRPSRVCTLTALVGLLCLSGCYRHVVSAKGLGAAEYDVNESERDNAIITSDLKEAGKEKPRRNAVPTPFRPHASGQPGNGF